MTKYIDQSIYFPKSHKQKFSFQGSLFFFFLPLLFFNLPFSLPPLAPSLSLVSFFFSLIACSLSFLRPLKYLPYTRQVFHYITELYFQPFVCVCLCGCVGVCMSMRKPEDFHHCPSGAVHLSRVWNLPRRLASTLPLSLSSPGIPQSPCLCFHSSARG